MIPDIYEKLVQDVEDVVRESQGYEFDLPGTAKVISIWRENKAKFYELFGEQLIWQYPKKITVALTDEMRDSMMNVFLTRVADILEINSDDSFLLWLNDNRTGFFENRVVEEFPTVPIKKGSKLLKSFKYFLEGSVLREIQDLASQFIQQNKIEGYLCLSIHPLDYLTASENNSNWRSCHALDGEYRGGNVSYMLDRTTIVCYLRSEKDVQLSSLPEGMLWNDKKWRMFLSLNEENEIVFLSRQYPFSCDTLLRRIMYKSPISTLGFGEIRYDGFKEIQMGAAENSVVELDHNFLLYRHNNVIIDTKDICMGDKDALNYNDIIYSPTYTPVFAVKNHGWRGYEGDKDVISRFRTEIGRGVPCFCGCGRLIDDSNTFICSDCWNQLIEGEIGHCSCCGESIYENDDYIFSDNDELVCGECAANFDEPSEDFYEED